MKDMGSDKNWLIQRLTKIAFVVVEFSVGGSVRNVGWTWL